MFKTLKCYGIICVKQEEEHTDVLVFYMVISEEVKSSGRGTTLEGRHAVYASRL